MVIFWLLFLLIFSFEEAWPFEIEVTANEGNIILAGRHECKGLEKGERKHVSIENGSFSPTGVRHKYTLTRKGEKEYLADINLRFEPMGRAYDGDRGGIKTGGTDLGDHVDKIYRARMKECLAEQKGKLKDDKGRIIDIRINDRLYQRTHTFPQDEEIEIFVRDKNHRSSSTVYASDIDCPTIIHELLHIMGLVDGYHERHKYLTLGDSKAKSKPDFAKRPAFDCRKLEPETNAMANHYALNRNKIVIYKYTFCECQDEDKTLPPCKDRIASHTGKSFKKCPKGFVDRGPYDWKGLPKDYKVLGREVSKFGILVDQKGPEKLPYKPPLSTEQVNAVLYPGCEEINGHYYACAENAYRTSKKNGGQGCIQNSCAPK